MSFRPGDLLSCRVYFVFGHLGPHLVIFISSPLHETNGRNDFKSGGVVKHWPRMPLAQFCFFPICLPNLIGGPTNGSLWLATHGQRKEKHPPIQLPRFGLVKWRCSRMVSPPSSKPPDEGPLKYVHIFQKGHVPKPLGIRPWLNIKQEGPTAGFALPMFPLRRTCAILRNSGF